MAKRAKDLYLIASWLNVSLSSSDQGQSSGGEEPWSGGHSGGGREGGAQVFSGQHSQRDTDTLLLLLLSLPPSVSW